MSARPAATSWMSPTCEIESHVAPEYPITPKEHGIEFLMEHRHLWVRSSKQHALLRIRAEVIAAAQEYLNDQGFVRFDTPILTPVAAEGTTNLFATEYFDLGTAYLAQTGQLYVEAGMMSFGKVYCFGPTFRAEQSKTRRHLTEFWMIEPEVAFADQDDNMVLQENFVSAIVQRVLERSARRARRCWSAIPPRSSACRRRSRASATTKRSSGSAGRRRRRDRAARGSAAADDRLGRGFRLAARDVSGGAVRQAGVRGQLSDRGQGVLYAAGRRRPEVVRCADLLAPEGYGEIIGGSQRIHDVELLERRMREHGLNPEHYQWYLDLRRYGTVPHSGFGMGIERCTAWIAGTRHIRETIPFPRQLYRIYP